MNQTSIVRTAIALSLACTSAAANADVISFSGSMSGLGGAFPDAGCAPLPFHGVLTSTTGGSSAGSMTYSHDICLSGISGPSAGTFVMDFGVDSFSGTLTGMATPSSTPGVVDLLFDYTILSGTGRFLGAMGSLTGVGTSDVTGGPPPVLSLAFNGTIDAPAVPEPGTWATLLLGFGVTGLFIRRRRRSQLPVRQIA